MSNYQLAFMWTDIAFFSMLSVICVFFFIFRRHSIFKEWRKIFITKRGVVSGAILLVFLCVAALDSLHFKKDTTSGTLKTATVISVLDELVAPLGQRYEKTYSVPFSLYSLNKETVNLDDGQFARVRPRLKNLSENITVDNKSKKIIASIFTSILSIFVVLIVGVISFMLVNKYFFIRTVVSVHAKLFFATFIIMTVTLFVLVKLGQDFYVMGTDKIGADVFYQALKSVRTGLLIGTLTTLIALPIALITGLMAGYYGGLVDDLIQFIYTTLSSIPGVLLIAAAILTLQVQMAKYPVIFQESNSRADLRLMALCCILGISSWTSLCRLIRAETLKIRSLDYIKAARVLGTSTWRILFTHILPNVMHIVFIIIALDFSGLVLAEAVLSYVGVGVDPTTHSWGNMINQSRLELAREPVVWWSLCASFSFMFTLVLAANIFADAVRDAFDPRLELR